MDFVKKNYVSIAVFTAAALAAQMAVGHRSLAIRIAGTAAIMAAGAYSAVYVQSAAAA